MFDSKPNPPGIADGIVHCARSKVKTTTYCMCLDFDDYVKIKSFTCKVIPLHLFLLKKSIMLIFFGKFDCRSFSSSENEELRTSISSCGFM